MLHGKRLFFIPLTFFLLINLNLFAQLPDLDQDIKMNAEKVDFDYERNISNFKGNVLIEFKDMLLKADNASLSMEKKTGAADGDVVIVNENQVFFCDEVNYDMNNKSGKMLNGSTVQGILFFKGDEIEQHSKDHIEISSPKISLTINDTPFFHATASKAEIIKDKYIKVTNSVFWLGPIPVLYLPWYTREISNGSVIGIRLGHKDDFGAMVKIKYNFYTTYKVKNTLNVEYFSERGTGLGYQGKFFQDQGYGAFKSFFIKDDEFEPLRSLEEAGSLNRYYINFDHTYNFTNGIKSSLSIDKHSDIDFYDDFYPSKFDENIQSTSSLRISKNTEKYSAGIYSRFKVNDFYNVLERMPQLYLDILPLSILDSDFYFSSNYQLTNLNQDFIDESIVPDYDSTRLYSNNTLSYSKKFFGWLTLNPKAIVEAIWYSDSIDSFLLDEETGNYNLATGSSELRTAYDLSISLSSNLYKIFNPDSYYFGFSRFRHSLTPQISLHYGPESSHQNAEILQFDELDLRNDEDVTYLQFDLYSRWQGKNEGGNAATVFNTKYSVTYDLEDNDAPWGNLYYRTEIRPSANFMLDLEFSYDIEESEKDYVRTDLSYRIANNFGLSLSYWDRNIEDDLIEPELSFNFNERLFLRAYGFYNKESKAWERSRISLILGLNKADIALQYEEKEFREEKTVYFTVSPKAITSQALTLTQ